MTITAHILVGGAIASAVPNPYIGIPLSLVSHHLLDIIPHWDEGWGWRQKPKLRLFAESFFDLALGLGVGYLMFVQSGFFGLKTNLNYFLICSFFAIAADLMEAPYLFLNWKFPPFSTFYNIQHQLQGKARLPWGVLTQVATVGAVVLVLKFF